MPNWEHTNQLVVFCLFFTICNFILFAGLGGFLKKEANLCKQELQRTQVILELLQKTLAIEKFEKDNVFLQKGVSQK